MSVTLARRGLHIDAVALSLVAAIVLLGLIMVTSASISIASKESRQRVFVPRAPARVVPDRLRAGRDRLLRAHRAPGEDGLAAADRGRRAAVLRADPRTRARGQRQPPLDSPAGFQFPGLRTGARTHAHLHRELRGAARGRVAQLGDGTHQAVGPAGIHGVAAARRAGLRRRLGVVHHRVRHPVHRRRAAALRR